MGRNIMSYDENGSPHGCWEIFFSDGDLYSKGCYIHGKRYGYWVCYWSNGELESDGHYINSEKRGYWERYYDNGQLFTKTYYNMGNELYQTYNNKFLL